MTFLRRHPFPVSAEFEKVVAVSVAFPEDILRSLVSTPLEIDGDQGLGFVTVAMVWTRNLRPAGFPKFLGQDFFLSSYRIFTRLRDDNGRRLRGLKILRSETDSFTFTRVRAGHAAGKMPVCGSPMNFPSARGSGCS